MKKTGAIVLALLMLAAFFSGCSNPEAPPNMDSDISTQDDSRYMPDLPNVNYKGADFTVYGRSGGWSKDLFIEGYPDNTVDTEVYKRNLRIEEKYGITFVPIQSGEIDPLTTVYAGEDVYNLIVDAAQANFKEVLNGAYTEFKWLQYVDLSNPWWNPYAAKGFSINGKIYSCMGDLVYNNLEQTYCMFFNKDLFDDLKIEYPYQTVYAGGWTFEKMKLIASQGSFDINGDSVIDSENDRYGYASELLSGPISEFFSQGGTLTGKDKDDYPYLLLWTAHNNDLISRYVDMAKQEYSYVKLEGSGVPQSMFKDGRLLIFEADLGSTSWMRALDTFEYGVLPCPKFDDTQKRYYTTINAATNMVCVPKTNTKLEMTSIILEAWAADSYYGVTPAFFENGLQQKGTRDNDSIEMMNIIRKGSKVDFLYYIGGLNGLDNIMAQLIAGHGANFSSYYAANYEFAEAKIESYIDTFNENSK